MTVAGHGRLTATLARDAMCHPIVAVDPAATLREVATTLGRSRIHAVVVDGVVQTAAGERLVWGVVSDLDVVRALAAADTEVTAGDIAATEAVTVEADDDLALVCALLAGRGCTHVIVVEHGRPVGIVSTLDVARAVGD